VLGNRRVDEVIKKLGDKVKWQRKSQRWEHGLEERRRLLRRRLRRRKRSRWKIRVFEPADESDGNIFDGFTPLNLPLKFGVILLFWLRIFRWITLAFVIKASENYVDLCVVSFFKNVCVV